MIGRLLPIEWAMVCLMALAWGTLQARVSTEFAGEAGMAELLARAPYDFIFTTVVPLIGIVNCGIRLGWDYTQGIAKYELMSGFLRIQVLAAHAIFLAASTLGTVTVAALGYLAAPVLAGRSGDVASSAAGALVVASLTAWAGSLPLYGVLLLVAVVASSLEVIVVVGLGLLALSGGINALVGGSAWLLPTVFMLRPVSSLANSLPGAVIAALVVAVGSTAASLRLWSRKDILR